MNSMHHQTEFPKGPVAPFPKEPAIPRNSAHSIGPWDDRDAFDLLPLISWGDLQPWLPWEPCWQPMQHLLCSKRLQWKVCMPGGCEGCIFAVIVAWLMLCTSEICTLHLQGAGPGCVSAGHALTFSWAALLEDLLCRIPFDLCA